MHLWFNINTMTKGYESISRDVGRSAVTGGLWDGVCPSRVPKCARIALHYKAFACYTYLVIFRLRLY